MPHPARWLRPLLILMLVTCPILVLQRMAGQNPDQVFRVEPKAACTDVVPATAMVDAKLDAPLFHARTARYAWHVVESEEGHLEDTTSEALKPDALTMYEVTSDCVSTHQGEHEMENASATLDKSGTLTLVIAGGLPAYASSLTVTLGPDLKYTCAFHAVYPGSGPPLRWNITSKSLKLKARVTMPGERLRAEIAVGFEEIWTEGGAEKRKAYTIKGHVKPVVTHPAG